MTTNQPDILDQIILLLEQKKPTTMLFRTTKFSLITTLILSVHTPVLADINWVKIDASSDGNSVYVETSSISTDGNIVRYWLGQQSPNGVKIKKTLSYLSGNCQTKLLRIRILASFDENDNILDSSHDGDKGQLYAAKPGSIAYKSLRYACAQNP